MGEKTGVRVKAGPRTRPVKATLPEDVWRKFADGAEAEGLSWAAYARRLIERGLYGRAPDPGTAGLVLALRQTETGLRDLLRRAEAGDASWTAGCAQAVEEAREAERAVLAAFGL